MFFKRLLVFVAFCVVLKFADCEKKRVKVPLFTCDMHDNRLQLMQNHTKDNREALSEILNAAAWDYKYHYSWVATGDNQDDQTNDLMGRIASASHNASLRFCINNYGARDFKAYKVSLNVNYAYVCVQFATYCSPYHSMAFVDGIMEKFNNRMKVRRLRAYYPYMVYPRYTAKA